VQVGTRLWAGAGRFPDAVASAASHFAELSRCAAARIILLLARYAIRRHSALKALAKLWGEPEVYQDFRRCI